MFACLLLLARRGGDGLGLLVERRADARLRALLLRRRVRFELRRAADGEEFEINARLVAVSAADARRAAEHAADLARRRLLERRQVCVEHEVAVLLPGLCFRRRRLRRVERDGFDAVA